MKRQNVEARFTEKVERADGVAFIDPKALEVVCYVDGKASPFSWATDFTSREHVQRWIDSFFEGLAEKAKAVEWSEQNRIK